MHCLHWDRCVSVGEWLSWRYQAQRHKGTNQNSLHCNLVAVLEHHQKTTPLMQNTIIYIYIHIFTLVYLFLLDAWVTVMIRICRQFCLEGHGEKTIPERYPNDTPVICWNSTSFTSIGKVHAHTHTQTNTEFLSYSVRQRKGLSVVLPLDARISKVENGVLLLSLAHPPMPCISPEEKLEKRQGTWL